MAVSLKNRNQGNPRKDPSPTASLKSTEQNAKTPRVSCSLGAYDPRALYASVLSKLPVTTRALNSGFPQIIYVSPMQ